MRSVLLSLVLAAFLAVGAASTATVQAQSITTPVPGPASAIPPIVYTLTEMPGVGPVNEPGRYTVQFLADGQISAKADCNWVAGTWLAGDGALDVNITMSSLALCPEGSLEQPFVLALHEATSYVVDGFALTISGPTGDMRFVPSMPAAA